MLCAWVPIRWGFLQEWEGKDGLMLQSGAQ